MKIIALLLGLMTFSAFAMTGREAWIHSNTRGRVKVLEAYKEFFKNFNSELAPLNETTRMNFSFFQDAWASNMDCIYAGWPSKRVNNLCSSPERNNPDYKNQNCQSGQMQCQPLLFGKGLCVSVASKSERNLAFTNCNKKQTKSAEEIVREIKGDGKEGQLLELLDFADNICKTGQQAGTGMCKRLLAVTDSLRAFKPEGSVTVKPTPDSTTDRNGGTSDGTTPTRTTPPQDTNPEVVRAVDAVENGNKAVSRVNNPEDCEPETEGTPFDREEPRPVNFDYVTSRRGADPAWDDTFIADKEDGLRPTGFEFRNVGPNSIAGNPIDPSQKTERQWRFVSEDGSRRETYLWITDDAGSGYLSQLMDSVILIVPRKMKPSVTAVGDELHVTLTTGEKVIYDKATRLVKGGVLSEGKVDLNPDRFKRKFAPISYSGTGISIRVDKRGEDPRLIPGNATVTQNGKTCQVPARELWNTNADFRYADDRNLVNFLNRKCGNKFSL